MGPGAWSKLFAAALLTLLLLCLAGCGGEEPITFTRENYEELIANPTAYDGANVDIVGRVTVVESDEDGVYFHMFADPANDAWPTIVVVPDPSLEVAELDYVRVGGVVRPEQMLPESMSGFTEEPIVVASSVAPVEPPPG